MNRLETRSLTGLVALYASRMLGLFMVLPVLSLYAPQYTGSTTFLMGVALGVYGLSQGLLQIPLGMLSDRFGRKSIIVAGMLLFLAGSVIAASAESIYGLILGRTLQGCGAVASTIMALLSDLTLEENRTKAMAAVGGSIGLSFALAMVLGPVLAARGGLSLIFWITAAMAVVGILLVLFWIPTPRAVKRVSGSEALALPSLFARTLTNTELLRLDFGVFVLHMVQMASWVAVPFLLEHKLGLSLEHHWLLYLSTMALGFLAMLPLIIVGERRHKLKPVFLTAVLLLAVAEMALFGARDNLPFFAVSLFLFFAAFNLLEATLPSLVSKVAPGGSRGTAMGFFSSSQFLGAFVGGAFGGYVAQNYGHAPVFLFSAVAAGIWAIVAFSMPAPRHWSSVVIDLSDYATHFSGEGLREHLPGIEEVTLVPDLQLLYLKVDRERFDRRLLDDWLGSNTAAGAQ